ncbi:MAG: hypothetical protein U1F36_18985 [Planctomycetota bacterium]
MAAARTAKSLKRIPTSVKSMIAKQLVGSNLERLGRVRPFPLGIPTDEWVISVLPKSAADAKRLIDALTARPGIGRFEVFPYGIVNPEIGRIDITMRVGGA